MISYLDAFSYILYYMTSIYFEIDHEGNRVTTFKKTRIFQGQQS